MPFSLAIRFRAHRFSISLSEQHRDMITLSKLLVIA